MNFQSITHSGSFIWLLYKPSEFILKSSILCSKCICLESAKLQSLEPAVMFRGHTVVYNIAFTSDTDCKLEVPKTNLRFDNVLVGLTDFTKSCYTHSYHLTQGKVTDQSLPMEEAHRTKSGRVPNTKLPLSSPNSEDVVILPVLKCNNIYKVLPTREACWSFHVQRFYWDLITQARLIIIRLNSSLGGSHGWSFWNEQSSS